MAPLAPCKSGVGANRNRPTVIVVGAGFAGLAAARALKNASFQVIVLESRDRIGGRVHTDYSFGFPVDLGASWLHGVSHANPLASLIGRLQLPLYRTSGDDSVLYDHDLESYALFENDGKQVPRELVAMVGDVFEAILEETRKVREEVLVEDISMRQALDIAVQRRPDLGLTGVHHKVLQWYLCRLEGWFAADVEKLSLLHWDEEDLLDGGHGLMVQGYRPVLLALADGLDIRLNHRVTRVQRLLSGGVALDTDSGASLFADAAVITLPAGVLQSAGGVRFDPPLPGWKRAAIADIGVGNENKIALHFARAFWPDVEFLGVVADTSYHCSYFLNLHKATSRPVLVYMPAGSLADDLEKMSDDAAAAFAMSQLRRICPAAPDPLNCLVTYWGSDPSSLGCYTYDRVGKGANVYSHLRAAVEPLFFAGEATSRDFPGTVHGAYSTGLQAAEECRKLIAASSAFATLDLITPTSSRELSHETLLPLCISRI